MPKPSDGSEIFRTCSKEFEFAGFSFGDLWRFLNKYIQKDSNLQFSRKFWVTILKSFEYIHIQDIHIWASRWKGQETSFIFRKCSNFANKKEHIIFCLWWEIEQKKAKGERRYFVYMKWLLLFSFFWVEQTTLAFLTKTHFTSPCPCINGVSSYVDFSLYTR